MHDYQPKNDVNCFSYLNEDFFFVFYVSKKWKVCDIFCHWHVTDHVERLDGLYEYWNTKGHLPRVLPTLTSTQSRAP